MATFMAQVQFGMEKIRRIVCKFEEECSQLPTAQPFLPTDSASLTLSERLQIVVGRFLDAFRQLENEQHETTDESIISSDSERSAATDTGERHTLNIHETHTTYITGQAATGGPNAVLDRLIAENKCLSQENKEITSKYHGLLDQFSSLKSRHADALNEIEQEVQATVNEGADADTTQCRIVSVVKKFLLPPGATPAPPESPDPVSADPRSTDPD
jgi:hypothetical protein